MATGDQKKRTRKKKPTTERPEPPALVRLNLGGAINPLPGYENWDQSTGQDAFPLAVEPGTVDEIRASHLLEHFSHTQSLIVLQDWFKALKPGGVLKVAVPDFDAIVDTYKNNCGDSPIEGWIMGDHTSDGMAHGAIFNRKKLYAILKAAGFVHVRGWCSSHPDSADSTISLNLQARRPAVTKTAPSRPASTLPMNIAACMSMPRLSFTDNYFCAYQALLPDKVPLRKYTGAFWGHCITDCIRETLAEFPDLDAILTLDYDTVFSRNDVSDLCDLLIEHPEADAVAALQVHRTRPTPLMTLEAPDGTPRKQVTANEFAPDITLIATAHFGLTLIRAEKIRTLPKPWFNATPDPDGEWGEGRIDDDIHFWRQWQKAGHTLYLANRVPVGHSELMIRWPNRTMRAIYQHSNEWWKDGKPSGVWV